MKYGTGTGKFSWRITVGTVPNYYFSGFFPVEPFHPNIEWDWEKNSLLEGYLY